jgi:hypothetical protein
MDRKNFYIGILSLSATVLLMANYFTPQPAMALQTIKDRDFSLVTASSQSGSDSLYVLDNRTGRVAIFAYDPAARSLVPKKIGDLTVSFNARAR